MHAPLLAAVLSSVLAHQDPLPAAEELLDRRESALGTGEARAKVRALAVDGTVGVAGTKMCARFEELYLCPAQGPEKVLLTTHWAGWVATTMGTDGAVSWSTDPGFGVMVKEGAESMT